MKQKMRKILTAVLCMILSCSMALPVYASDPLTNHLTGWPQMKDIAAESAVVMNADNGAILYSLDRDTKRYPASITKILTCLLTIENANLTDKVTITQDAVDVAVAGNSNITPVLGEEFTVEQCLYMLMLKSANDIAVQLADTVGGSVEKFADMMNARAKKIGCTGTHFTNPSGLPDENHYSTAYDMALIMQECLKNDTFRKVISTASYTVPATNKTSKSRTYENHNKLIQKDSEYYYKNCIGGKTGYIAAGGRTLIAAAKDGDTTLIAVTMKCASKADFTDMAALFDYGFKNFTTSSVTAEDTSAGTKTTGSVTLPAGISQSSLTATQSGSTITYTYEKIPVGSASVEKSVPVSTLSAASESTASADTGALQTERHVLLIFLIILVIAGILVAVTAARNKAKRRREYERRRRERMRRRK